MKRVAMMALAIVCVVVSQKKTKQGYRTECLGIEVNGVVILPEKVETGKAVSYKPFIVEGDEDIHGAVLSVGEAPRKISQAIPEVPSDYGKLPQ